MADNLMGMSVPQLRRWSRGQPLDHRQLNEPVEAINQMMTGVGPPRQTMGRVGAPAAISAVAQFKLVAPADAFPDHLMCVTWDGTTEGTDIVLVAKPWDVRRTPFDGEGDEIVELYTYFTPTERDALIRIGRIVERQIIIRRYEVGVVLYATKNVKGGTGVTHEDSPVVWLDDNRAGRAWAAKYIGP